MIFNIFKNAAVINGGLFTSVESEKENAKYLVEINLLEISSEIKTVDGIGQVMAKCKIGTRFVQINESEFFNKEFYSERVSNFEPENLPITNKDGFDLYYPDSKEYLYRNLGIALRDCIIQMLKTIELTP